MMENFETASERSEVRESGEVHEAARPDFKSELESKVDYVIEHGSLEDLKSLREQLANFRQSDAGDDDTDRDPPQKVLRMHR